MACFKNAVIISYEQKSKQTTDAFMQRAIWQEEARIELYLLIMNAGIINLNT